MALITSECVQQVVNPLSSGLVREVQPEEECEVRLHPVSLSLFKEADANRQFKERDTASLTRAGAGSAARGRVRSSFTSSVSLSL